MGAEWYCKVMGAEYGPMSQDELVERVRQRNLGPEDLVRKAGGDWLAVFEVGGLMELASRPPKQELADTSESKSASAAHSDKATSDSDWFCLASGEKRGPMRFDELQTLANKGLLRAKDRVWRSSTPKFKPASEVEGLDLP